jgi:hypothetical protein
VETYIILPREPIRIEDLGKTIENLLKIKKAEKNLPAKKDSSIRNIWLHNGANSNASYEVQFLTEEKRIIGTEYVNLRELEAVEDYSI